MNALTFTFRGKYHTFHAPSVWNEVNAEQLLLWTKVAHSGYDEDRKLSFAVPIFYNIPVGLYKYIKDGLRLQIFTSLEKMFRENRLNVWLIPKVKILWWSYYGPDDKLSNVTAYEFFNACEPLYWKYKNNGDESALTSLCAVLYRPKRWGTVVNDIRKPFTDAGTRKRSKWFSYLPLNTRRAILFNYEGCRNFIVKNHPKAFKASAGGTNKRGDVTLSLAGGPLGDLNSTRNTNLYDFLLHLVRLVEQEEELKTR